MAAPTFRSGKGDRLRDLVNGAEPVFLPGVGTALHARIMELVGFQAVTMSGAMTALYYGGFPDIGIMTQTEVADVAARVQAAVGIPVVVDCDNGYGNVTTVRRTVELMIHAGVGGIQLEDQAHLPKKLYTDPTLHVLPFDEAVAKVEAAADVRRELGSDLFILGRCDAIKAMNGGIEEAARRVAAFAAVGADAVFCPNFGSRADYLAVSSAAGVPIISSQTQYDRVSPLPQTPRDLKELGIGGVYLIEAMSVAAVAAVYDQAQERLSRGMAWDYEMLPRLESHPLGTLQRLWDLGGYGDYVKRERMYMQRARTRGGKDDTKRST